jgi:hypothetical protein
VAKWVGVAAIPNQCSWCGKFKPWDQLITHFVPDSECSSEDESWRECLDCREKRTESAPVVVVDE